MHNGTILIIDDDQNINKVITLYVQREGYKFINAYDGRQGIDLFRSERPDLVILDIMLPVMDGWEVLKEIRKISDTPVIMVSAKGETIDKILGLEIGADDYIVKPFEPKELLARIKAVFRRYEKSDATDEKIIRYDNLEINLSDYKVIYKGESVEMPPKEMELLYFLASKPNKVFTREQLLSQVWDFDFYGDSRTVDVHIKRIREKLYSEDQNWSIRTVWGVGYKFDLKDH